MKSVSPILYGSVSIVSGDLLGALVDRIIVMVGKRARIIDKLNLGDEATSLLDSCSSLFFQVGLIGIGTELISGGLPWMTENPAAFSLYLLGLWSTSSHLKRNLRVINSILLKEGDYQEQSRKNKGLSTPSSSSSSSASSSSSTSSAIKPPL